MTPECKALGIPKFQPYFKIKHLIEKHNVTVFSSNFPLYGDISSRFADTLIPFSADLEKYSVDELFILLPGITGGLHHYAESIKDTVFKHLRLPVCVGVAPTKTLAKLANHAAKKIPKLNGVCVLDSPDKWEWVLKRCPVTDIWGVGQRLGARLNDAGITTGYDLATANQKLIKKVCGVNTERTLSELNGTPVFELEQNPPDKKQIYVTKSFGEKTTELLPILEAVSSHASLATQKLRSQNHLAKTINVFIHTSRFASNFHQASRVVLLPYPTNDERVVVGAARQAARDMYNRSKTYPHLYAKAGFGILEAVDRKYHQHDMLTPSQSAKTDSLMTTLDSIRDRQGRNSIFIGARGCISKTTPHFDFASPQYTTRWKDIPVVKS
jgi:DNA polymerase V